MLAIFVEEGFGAAVDQTAQSLGIPIRLGAREIDIGEHAGEWFVPASIFNSCIEWQQMTMGSLVGGTALSNGEVIIEAGRTAKFRGSDGDEWGPYEIKDVNPATLFTAHKL